MRVFKLSTRRSSPIRRTTASAVVVVVAMVTASAFIVVETFSPIVHYPQGSLGLSIRQQKQVVSLEMAAAAAAATKSKSSSLSSSSIPNPFKALPWNARREKEREARRIKKESAKLHRELGIAEDATFEEINEATDALLSRVAGDMKAKIKIEVAKDRILQMRLSERLAGLAKETVEARARTAREKGWEDDDDMESRRDEVDTTPSKSWLARKIKKPDPEWRNQQLRVYGILSAVCLQIPAFADLGRFMTGVFCCGQLVSRGQPKSGVSVNPMFGRRQAQPHQRTAFIMAFGVWTFARILAFAVVKTSTRLKDSVVAPGVEVAIMSVIAALVNCYVQLYDANASPAKSVYDEDDDD